MHSSIYDTYIPQADRIENMIMIGESAAEQPTAIGSRRLFYDRPRKKLYLDVRYGGDNYWDIVFSQDAAIILLDTDNFDGVLSSSDSDLQQAMETIDDHGHAATLVTLDTTNFAGILGPTDDEVQHAFDTIDDMTHADLPDAGANDHGDIDTHIADATIHFTEASIDHTAIQNIGSYSHGDIDNHIDDGTIHFTLPIAGTDVEIEEIGTATYDDVQDFVNQAWSSGHVSGMELTDGGGNTVAVAAGTGFIATADDENARIIKFFDFAGANTAVIADGTTKYIGIEYNAGTPQILLGDTFDLDRKDAFSLGWVTREGATLHITNAPVRASELPHNIAHTLRETLGFKRADFLGGIILGESNDTNRNVNLSAGEVYFGMNEFDIDAVDTSGADTFTRYYPVAGVWTAQTGLTQWPNTQYSDGTDLQTMTVNRYGCLWFYVDLEGGDLLMLYGTSNASTQTAAEAEAPPASPPERIVKGAMLVGRYVYRASATTPELVQSAFNVAFNAAGVSDHGALAGLSDDDHAQYLLASDATDRATFAANWTDLTDGGDTTLHDHADAAGRDTTAIHTTAAVEIGALTTLGVLTATDYAIFETAAGIKTKLSVTSLVDSSNFIGVSWIDLTDGGETVLHKHDGRYYTETEINTLLGAYLKKDGSVPLTADWDVGAFDIRAADLTADSGGVYTDNVKELTAAAGVTIDGALIKDNRIALGDSTPGTPANPITVKDTASSDLIRYLDGGGVLSSPQAVVILRAEGSNVRNNGAGAAFVFAGQDSASNQEFMGRIGAYWRNFTDGAEDAGIVIMGRNAGGGAFGLDVQARFFDGQCNLKVPTSAPADADLEVNSLTFYYDGGGATKYIRVKHKDSGGTTRTGIVATIA